MKKKQILAGILAASFMATVFAGTAASASETTPETNEAGLPIETAVTEAPQTEAPTEAPAETAAEQPAETEAPAEETEAATEAVTEEAQSETEFNAHPEAHISLPYDDPDMWWQLVMPNPAAIDTGVNIRASRSEEEGEIIGFLYEGNGAWLLEKGDEWTELYSGGMTGFVRNEYLLYGEEARAIVDNYAMVGVTATWAGTPVYAEPDGASEVVKTLNIGDDLLLAEDGDHWVKVRLDKETTAYVSLDDVRKCRFLNAGMPVSGDYGEIPEPETETELPEETAAEEQEEYVAPQTEAYVAPQTNAYVAPQTEAPATEAPQTEAPKQTEAPQTEAPKQTEAPQTEAPKQTEAPQTEAPQTEAPATEAPATEAPQEDNSISEGDDAEVYIDDGDGTDGSSDGGWYDADTGKYYDENGNEVTG